jgi:enoyl-CoA hydratase/carnithine racemase
LASRSYLDNYADKYRIARIARTKSGIITVRLHTGDGEVLWGIDADEQVGLADLFADVANDPDNRVMILTGTGDSFLARTYRGDKPPFDNRHAKLHSPETFESAFRDQRLLHANLLDIEVPIIAAVNGPVTIHSELPLLCDIVLAADTALFQDSLHMVAGVPPGDGVQLIYEALLGPVRAKYFLLTGQKISAQAALGLGMVNEVLAGPELLGRAMELAEQLVEAHPLTLRYARRVLNTQLRQAFANEYDHALALEALAIVQLRGWRRHMGGRPPRWEDPVYYDESEGGAPVSDPALGSPSASP